MLWDDLRRQLGKVEKPARYTGGETGAVQKDWACVAVRFVLAFPDVYEVGASHMGSEILYAVLNDLPWVACERVFAPWPDMEELLREEGWPLYTLESRAPLSQFHVVGFSLQYELTYTNVLTMLDLGGIPIRAKDRGDGDSLVIAGGPCAMAPEPLADFIDAFALGDGEELVVDIVEAVRDWKEGGGSRKDLLRALHQIEAVYVPSLWEGEGRSQVVTRRVLGSLEGAPYAKDPIVPLIPPIHDRAAVEIFRGCGQGCRFCQAGMLYRPVRERELDTVVSMGKDLLAKTGFGEVSLCSLSSADYSHIEEAIRILQGPPEGGVRVSLPSLRVDSYSIALAELLGAKSTSGLTLAPEAGSQRMRDIINKRLTEEQILEAARDAFRAGYSRIKLYFMIGLPWETDADVLGIARLAAMIRGIGRGLGRRPTIVVSVSGFVPKPHTPFQWEAAISVEELRRRQHLLRGALKGPGLVFRYHDADLTFLESVFARGDRLLGEVLYLAWKSGCRFDSWPEQFRWDLWDEAFRLAGVDPMPYAYRERALAEALPWDHLSSGVRKEFLWRERERAAKGQTTLDCRDGACTDCGVCPDLGVTVRLARGGLP